MLEIMNQRQELAQIHTEFNSRVHTKQLKLPKIDRMLGKESSKGVRSNPKLPTLKLQNFNNLSMVGTQRETQQQQYSHQIQKKIKLILESNNITQISQNLETQEDDFQKQINENKQLIKKIKNNNANNKKNIQQFNHMLKYISKKQQKGSRKNKLQNVQKTNKQNDLSIQNKINKKLKQIQSINIRNTKNKQQKTSQKSIKIQFQLNKQKSKQQMVLNKKLTSVSQKQLNNLEQNDGLTHQNSKNSINKKKNTLFDILHNYLDNPKKPQIQILNPTALLKQKNQLQQKLKHYQQKLNFNPDFIKKIVKSQLQIDQSTQNKNMQKIHSIGHWKKIGVSQKLSINQQRSSFDQQLDKINSYQLRNNASLQKYLQNQKFLLQVQMARKQSQDKCTINSKKSI